MSTLAVNQEWLLEQRLAAAASSIDKHAVSEAQQQQGNNAFNASNTAPNEYLAVDRTAATATADITPATFFTFITWSFMTAYAAQWLACVYIYLNKGVLNNDSWSSLVMCAMPVTGVVLDAGLLLKRRQSTPPSAHAYATHHQQLTRHRLAFISALSCMQFLYLHYRPSLMSSSLEAALVFCTVPAVTMAVSSWLGYRLDWVTFIPQRSQADNEDFALVSAIAAKAPELGLILTQTMLYSMMNQASFLGRLSEVERASYLPVSLLGQLCIHATVLMSQRARETFLTSVTDEQASDINAAVRTLLAAATMVIIPAIVLASGSSDLFLVAIAGAFIQTCSAKLSIVFQVATMFALCRMREQMSDGVVTPPPQLAINQAWM